ncbi:MAG: NADH-quinone oxidoreductase subunit NuoN [Marinobacter sp.]|uniref:NADH-quinone oxidoreductase subunit NuoN n=1 Tax=Marinobacter sp. TaxID=50741 RepID=UPI00299DEF08|nr:NADH-quinone oxidoreductase subunit NuoN [Marinobacter sp.]MDX1635108.1 NADH-quinone oxidoreductase subunit NuoN [Marinobacter sp.]
MTPNTLGLQDLMALAPVILVAATAVVVMLGIAWQRRHTATAVVTVAGLNLALVSVPLVATLGVVTTPLLVIDGVTLFGAVLVLVSSLACGTIAHAYLSGYPGPREEFYLLMLTAAAGAMVLIASTHLATLFFGLELMSMPLYGMLAYSFRQQRALEAGIKYLVLSAAGTAFLLFGMALLYAQSGHLDLAGLAAGFDPAHPVGLAGAVMMLVGLGFKLSIVPFHLWTPDVYEGSPGPATILLASVSKLAVFLVLLRLLELAPAFQAHWLSGLLAVLAWITMLAGNLLALQQPNLKRLLGYSSIAHFGYLLVALVVTSELAVETTAVYLVTYLVATLAAFGVVTLVSSPYSGDDASALHHYRGLFWRRPYLAAVLTVSLLSLAGIPFTAGFIGKFYIVALAVESGRWWLLGALILGSAIGLFYYLRVMVILYLVEPGMRRRDATNDWATRAGGLVLIGLAVLVLVLGLYPTPVIHWASGLVLAGG